ncbi:nucleotide-binding protein [Sinomonas sp. JGH33]|uniref:Nucleotide-binding protein n=1 Tax=Sinomonas terricola TaxID=3110330 RepID=A0ABU5TCD1_9MICC|nr:nucleotide-binding protein [Sinomonas sp. JGH33]MEA5457315.1 nucleotide-binding protein [Sinomonas sp. JGH33]
MAATLAGETPERVFVVHGRNAAARDAMFAFLRSIGLKPLEWDQAMALTGKASPYIGEVLDVAFEDAQAIVVLLTPDDIAYIRSEYAHDEDPDLEPRGQARPNVLFEAGMAMGRNADRTVLVEMGDLRPFSDVGGRHAVRMDNTPQRRKSLAERLKTAGCPADISGADWMSAGDFTPPPKPGNGLPMGKRVPSRDRTGPHVDGHWYARSGSSVDQVKVTNNGGVPIHDVQLEVPEELSDRIQLHGHDEPVAKLPVGKSFTVRAWTTNRTLGGNAPNQFELRVVGRLEGGEPFEQDIYLDAVGQ